MKPPMAQVQVTEGILEGELIRNEFGGDFYSFKGIPYAEAPIGELRFKAPQPPQSWKGVRSAKELGPVCAQYDMFSNKIRDGSEDCLYLNIYSPDIRSKKPLSVMVWIHGGGYISGCGNDEYYGPELLVRHGVILVTLNYRLEVVGFLSLNSEDVPGNAGMKDQVAALRWIKKNIHNFGGDPNNVTIFGESAGGACVSYHLISPMSKGLFRRAIAQSGCSECWWSQAYNPRERARVLARQMGLDSDDDNELYDFFKSQPIERLIKKKAGLTWADEYKLGTNLYFGVVDEKQFGDNERFFYNDLAHNSKYIVHEDVEIMVGYTQDEGLLSLSWQQSDIEKILYQANFIPQYLVTNALALNCPLKDQLEVASKIRKYYFDDKIIVKDNLKSLVQYFTMEIFVYGIMAWAKKISSAKRNTVFLYKFTCSSERNVMSELFGISKVTNTEKLICHCDDLAYLFPLKGITSPININSKSYKMINRVTKLWTDFAKFGNPTPDLPADEKWKPYTTEKERYMDIGEKLVPGSAPDKEDVLFWDNLLKDYKQYLH